MISIFIPWQKILYGFVPANNIFRISKKEKRTIGKARLFLLILKTTPLLQKPKFQYPAEFLQIIF